MADVDWQALERGCCSRATAAEKGCALCVPRYAAIDRLKAIVSAGDRLQQKVRDAEEAQHWKAVRNALYDFRRTRRLAKAGAL